MRKSVFAFFLYRSIYNNQPIPYSQCVSIEHLVPKRLFVDKVHASHPLNLVPCDRFTNAVRSDLRLGDPDLYRHIFDQYGNSTFSPESMVSMDSSTPCFLVIDGSGSPSGVIHRVQRVFYPSPQTDMVLVCRGIIAMLFLFPYLYGCLDQIVQDPGLLQKYHSYSTDGNNASASF